MSDQQNLSIKSIPEITLCPEKIKTLMTLRAEAINILQEVLGLGSQDDLEWKRWAEEVVQTCRYVPEDIWERLPDFIYQSLCSQKETFIMGISSDVLCTILNNAVGLSKEQAKYLHRQTEVFALWKLQHPGQTKSKARLAITSACVNIMGFLTYEGPLFNKKAFDFEPCLLWLDGKSQSRDHIYQDCLTKIRSFIDIAKEMIKLYYQEIAQNIPTAEWPIILSLVSPDLASRLAQTKQELQE